MTDAQKQAERLAEIERENAELKTAKARAEVANTKSIPAEILAGPASDSPEDLERFADALIAFRGEPAKGPVIPGQGKQPAAAPESKAEAFGRALGLND